jgi:Sulfotransferase family
MLFLARMSSRFLANSDGVRLALIGTPRSGNTWLRHLLAQMFAAQELATHDPAEVAWSGLAPNCVLQIHQHRTPALEQKLAAHGFRVVVLVRHPFDVLLSILHFATHDGSTCRWLPGEGGDESPIHGAMPGSAAFLEYATGQRAAALLSISPQWWDAPGCLQLRYENLVADPVGQMERLVQMLGVEPCVPVARAVADNALAKLRLKLRGRHHCWQGQPGHWKRLLVTDVADAIAARHAALLERFNYDCVADPRLTPGQADRCWLDLNHAELTEKLWHYTATRHELERTRLRLEQLQTAAARAVAGQCSLEQLATELARSNEGRPATSSWKIRWLQLLRLVSSQ